MVIGKGMSPLQEAAPRKQWKSDGLQRLQRASQHQMAGLRHGLMHDAAIRQVTVGVVVFVVVALFMPVARVERLLLILSVMLVGVVETLNSAIEACVDRISEERHPLSGLAKDYGSVAVAGTVLMAGLCWLVITGPLVLQWLRR
jgi:diacylglycerol kinase (ATP)